MTKKLKKQIKGFTLIELMVVMAIIAVLATLIIGAIRLATDTAKETVHRSNAKAIQTALEANYAKNRRYCTKTGDTANANEIACTPVAGNVVQQINASGASTTPMATAASGLGIDISTTSECTVAVQSGGGKVHIEPAEYWIRPYDAACSSTLAAGANGDTDAYDSNNDIKVGY